MSFSFFVFSKKLALMAMEQIYMKHKSKNQKERQKIIIRCNISNRPVFDYEICSEFKLREGVAPGSQHNCKTCIHSF